MLDGKMVPQLFISLLSWPIDCFRALYGVRRRGGHDVMEERSARIDI